ncbi:hypothetical protein NPIL_235911 [Nephila pilipes]|uniref:Uncharacterized protein n=1 Tax=Nephila pilipes TaxID=299642 RepID=A0A8X6PPE2_NEPPI|nr:hypothetical protein NPIL_235911 [Nephila pilipes]
MPHNKLLYFPSESAQFSESYENETSAITNKGEDSISNLNLGSNIFYPTSSVTNGNVQSSFSATSLVQNRLMSTVLLNKPVFFIRDKYRNLQSIRELLNADSQSDIMTKECAIRLEL